MCYWPDLDWTPCFVAQGCVFTQDINQAIYISDAMETGTVQVNAAPARGPDVSFTVAWHHWCSSIIAHFHLADYANHDCTMHVLLP
jgi:hypothetical protein